MCAIFKPALAPSNSIACIHDVGHHASAGNPLPLDEVLAAHTGVIEQQARVLDAASVMEH